MSVSDIRHLPVVGAGSAIVGILSDRDLARGRAKGLAGSDRVDRAMTTPCALASFNLFTASMWRFLRIMSASDSMPAARVSA